MDIGWIVVNLQMSDDRRNVYVGVMVNLFL